jgi:hypothetical protein
MPSEPHAIRKYWRADEGRHVAEDHRAASGGESYLPTFMVNDESTPYSLPTVRLSVLGVHIYTRSHHGPEGEGNPQHPFACESGELPRDAGFWHQGRRR